MISILESIMSPIASHVKKKKKNPIAFVTTRTIIIEIFFYGSALDILNLNVYTYVLFSHLILIL